MNPFPVKRIEAAFETTAPAGTFIDVCLPVNGSCGERQKRLYILTPKCYRWVIGAVMPIYQKVDCFLFPWYDIYIFFMEV